MDPWNIGITILSAILCWQYLGVVVEPKYSFIGDEWALFESATNVVDKYFLVNPFSAGVYENHSMFASVLQAMPMVLFGKTIFGWKVSNILALFFGSLLTFAWGRVWFGSLAGFIAGVTFVCSSYLSNFGMIGYPSHLALCHLVLLHFLISLLVLEKVHDRWSFLLSLGIASGLSAYLFGGLVFPIILSPYALFLLSKNHRPRLLKSFGVVVVVGLLIAVPGFFDSTYRNSLLGLASYSIHPLTASERVSNALGFLVSFASMPKNSHYAYGAYLDFASRIGVFLGIAAALWGLVKLTNDDKMNHAKHIGAVIVLMSAVFAAFSYGLSNPYPEPPRTRGIFMLPQFCALAGFGVSYVLARFSRVTCFMLLGTFICATLYLNMVRRHQFFLVQGITPEACVLWKIQLQNLPSDKVSTVYIKQKQPDEHINMLNKLLHYYSKPNINVQSLNQADTYTGPKSTVIEPEKEVYPKACRDLENNELSPWLRSFNFESYWW